MKLAYWGNYTQIIESNYFNFIEYFVFEKNKVSNDFLYSTQFKNKKIYVISSKNEIENIIKKNDIPELTIVGSFGYIFDENIIKLLNRKIINIHPGILPHYKGRHPLPQMILNNEKFMGLTAHVLNEKIDSGIVILGVKKKIDYSESYRYNEQKLLNSFKIVIDNVIDQYKKNEINFKKNIIPYGNYYPPLKKNILDKIIKSKKLSDLF